MKKFVAIGVVALVVIAALATAGVALAQGPATPPAQSGNVGCGMMGGAFDFGANGQSTVDVLASLFKMTPEELAAQLQGGTTILELATERGLTTADVVEAVVDARSVAINEAVKAGRITQAQADLMIENMTENMTQMIESGVQCGLGAGTGAGCGGAGTGVAGRGGMMGGRGGMMGGRGGMMGGRWNARAGNTL